MMDFRSIGDDMGQVIQFVSKSERERVRLIQEARAIYDSIFPPADPSGEPQGNATIGRAANGDAGNLA
ncbi:hypothetical protein G6321_00004350 [Bradyrhizobium barranii subsp. barranii]|uniref:Uncharacterized protein n=1 Tax=Bradyrhizobium barranii subsp. barranii TaxID=2823807 RepID=A0A7Z0QA05_9BRAD|nr:hypothetical protein [Bradyrhizobium barranii]UGX99467.1 hypothetical protein G6321_00004350 [Bradyrhizobium barranii subsp. barranii]